MNTVSGVLTDLRLNLRSFLLEIALDLLGERVDGLFMRLVEGTDHGIVDELAVLEVIIDERHVQGHIDKHVQVAASKRQYSARMKARTNWMMYARLSTHQNLRIRLIFSWSWLDR